MVVAATAAALWQGLLARATAAVVSASTSTQSRLPSALQPDAAEALLAALVCCTALGSLLVWNTPYALLFFLRAQGHRTAFDRYLIQGGPPPIPAASPTTRDGGKGTGVVKGGQRTSWAEFWRAALTMPQQVLFLSAVLAWGGGARAILHFRPDWRAALEGYLLAAGAKGAAAQAAAAPAMVIPAWGPLSREIAVCLLIEDACFYWLHRLLHHPALYATVHKTHHYYKAPLSFAATYATLLDFAVGDAVPLTVAVVLACGSLFSLAACVCARLFLTTEIHSGYAFPWSVDTLLRRLLRSGERDWFYGGSRHHDLHHERTHGNYASSFVFWDVLCGTYICASAPESKQKQKGKEM